MIDWALWIESSEQNLRAGKVHLVLQSFRSLSLKNVPRSHALKVANIFRRCDRINQALRILSPYVRPVGASVKATPAEIAEYCVCLIRAGIPSEALELLNEIDESEDANILLFKSFAHFATWNYTPTLPLLRHYVETVQDPYLQQVGNINLAAAQIASGLRDEAFEILKLIEPTLIEKKMVRLLSNLHELRAQIFIENAEFEKALYSLTQASSNLDGQQVYDSRYIRKWKSISIGLKSKSVEPLMQFKKECIEARDWENLRDCDYYELKLKFDRERFQKIYFGTPNPIFRAKLTQAFGEIYLQEYSYGSNTENEIDLVQGQINGNHLSGKPLDLLRALGRDLYKPVSTAKLFNDLYPDEFFNVFSSPTRVHQLVKRTKQILDDHGLHDSIISANDAYRFSDQISLVIPRDSSQYKTELTPLGRFHKEEIVSAKTLREQLGMTPGQLRVFLERAMREGKLIRTGAGAGTKYKVAA